MTGPPAPPAGTAVGRWAVEQRTGTAAELHGPWPPPAAAALPRLAVCRVVAPGAVVLGSTQGLRVAPAAPGGPAAAAGRAVLSSGLPVVRRRAGGGAVVVRPGGQVWIDVWVPRDDRLWSDDVVTASWWLGDAWAAALGDVGIPGAAVHRGRLTPAAPDGPPPGPGASTRPVVAAPVCFAALGAGEVVTGRPARKVVGLSQHRTRLGARFLTMAPVRWEPSETVAALVELGLLPQPDDAALGALAAAAVGLADAGAEASPGEDLADTVAGAVVRHVVEA